MKTMCLRSETSLSRPSQCASDLITSSVSSSPAVVKNSSDLDPFKKDTDLLQYKSSKTSPSMPIKSSMKNASKSRKRVKKSVRFAPPSDSFSDSMDDPIPKDTPSQYRPTSRSSRTKICQEDEAVRTDIISYLQPASTMTESQLTTTFWQVEDYEIFRSTASYIASEIRRASQQKGSPDDTLTTSTRDSDTVQYDHDQASTISEKKKRKDALDYDAVMKTAYQLCMYHSEAICKANKENNRPSLTQDSSSNKNTSPISKLHRSSKIHPTTRSVDKENELSSQNQIYDDNQMCLPPNLFNALTQWVKVGHSRRGLEKFSVSFQVEARPMQRRSAIRSVLIAQQFLRQQQRQGTNLGSDIYTQGGSEEFLRQVSEQFSRTSKLFGIVMGHADAAAIGHFNLNN